jgi:predicted transcriptional regulator
MEEQREADVLRVEDAMQPDGIPLLEADDTLTRVWKKMETSPGEYWLVRLNPSGWSILSKKELKTMLEEGKGELSVGSVLVRRGIPYLHPDQPLETALRYVDQWPIVPVVSRANYRKLEGVITKQDVLSRYRAFEVEGE